MPFIWIGLLTVSGLAALLGGLTVRRKRIRYPDPKSFITTTPAGVEVKPLDGGAYELSWTNTSPSAQIFTGTQPDAINTLVAEVTNAQQTQISGLDPATRPYFAVVFADGERVVVAERFLPLTGGVNFRDIGGYLNADGQRVRWGKLFRSGSLASLTPADYDYLERIGVHLVCDLRNNEEIAVEPDILPASMEYLHALIYTDSDSMRRLRTLFVDPRALSILLLEMYTRQMIDQNAKSIGSVLRRLSEPPSLPAIIHCTAGKDRTGITAAVLLSLLGVPDAVITADYSLSNHYYTTFRQVVQKALPSWLGRLGISIDDMQVLLTANPVIFQDVLNHIRHKYGSVEGYLLDAAGLDAAVIERLKVNFLEAV